MTHCDDCGTKLDSGGICANCDEELFIAAFQGEYVDYPISEEFSLKIDEQTARARERNRGIGL